MLDHPPSLPDSASVLVVGAGPVGATLALELAHHGVRSTVVERSTTVSAHPKMDFINGRSMELLRRLGVTDEIRRRGVAADEPFDFHWITDPAQPPVSVWTYPSVAELRQKFAEVTDGSAPLEPYQRLQGSLLEDVLRQRVREHPLVDLREGWNLLDLTDDGEGVTARLADVGQGTEHTLRAAYVVGCDGGGSTVRRCTDITTQLSGPSTRHCDVYFRSEDPALFRNGKFFLTIAAGGATLVNRDGGRTWTGTFVLPDGEPEPDEPLAVVKERLGFDFEVDEVLNVAYWYGRLAVADSYRAGRVFLAGDSAHQFYPTGGHGANTGLGDAVDLGWKLAATLTGRAGPGLLDSYEAERRPVALFNREMCANLLAVWMRFPQLAAAGASRSQLAGYLAKESFQIDNLGIHFGYRYTGSPVVRHEDTPDPGWEWQSIVPTTLPGGRAPNVRLADGTPLFDRLGTGFTLVDLSGENRGKDLVEQARRRGLPVELLTVDSADVRAVWARDLVLVRPDHHVAWRGDVAPEPRAWDGLLEEVTGG
ncbi:FAD-dependent monooxygenase [Streptomyces sp. NBC_00335]|uniref:FAD-dependent monooxygenase n=1 Tax=unclassified Streptomyces TaxID=2593676 RepID=UPI002259FE11|nr:MULTISPECIES: FAD-dependent monooxygenase [unclassified Streptomyces]MCX5405562.1 FAD-dependent monooxygenase [Streptomyces sp. NBC_00086]